MKTYSCSCLCCNKRARLPHINIPFESPGNIPKGVGLRYHPNVVAERSLSYSRVCDGYRLRRDWRSRCATFRRRCAIASGRIDYNEAARLKKDPFRSRTKSSGAIIAHVEVDGIWTRESLAHPTIS